MAESRAIVNKVFLTFSMFNMPMHVAFRIALLLIQAHTATSFLRSLYKGRVGEKFTRITLHDAAQTELAIAFDGCVADTVPRRIDCGIEAAHMVWPDLEFDHDDITWLHNKLFALAHCFESTETEFSATCDYALATRLLLEEQLLDDSRSNGRSGKYASKFHPRKSSASESKTVSRPLTVGEISANWKENIRDSLLVRYHCNKQDPMPALQTACVAALRAHTEPLSINPDIIPVLSSTCHKSTVLLDHEIDRRLAETALKSAGLSNVRLEVYTEYVLREQIAANKVFLVDSYWERLQGQVHANTGELVLAQWAPNVHPVQVGAATMNPWTNVIEDVIELEEALSARVY